MSAQPQEDEAASESAEVSEAAVSLSDVAAEQLLLRQDFERLAAAVTPLLTKQFRDTEARIRALEVRIRARQERPLVLRIAKLLNDTRRIASADDIRAHVQDELMDALTSFGYQEFGSVDDLYDPDWHEAIEGAAGMTSIVTSVHARGLACFGDVLVKAKVTIADGDSDVPYGFES